jgi:hypothetical protein
MTTNDSEMPEGIATTVTVAKLDAAGVYWGIAAIPEAQLTPAHVQVPADCDLQPGRYRWVADKALFEPLLVPQTPTSEGQPSIESVLNDLVSFALGQGATSPVLTSYAAHYASSINASGSKA